MPSVPRPAARAHGARCRTRASASALTAALLLQACGPDPAPPVAVMPEATEVRKEPAPDAAEARQELSDLGYVDFGPASKVDEGDGVVVHVEGRAAEGYVLVCAIPFATAVLIDSDGTEIHRWTGSEQTNWTRAKLARNGDLLVVGRRDDAEGFYLERRNWSDEVLWTLDIKAHHDVQELSDGRLVALEVQMNNLPRMKLGALPNFEPKPLVKDDALTVVEADGTQLDDFSLGRVLAKVPEQFQPSIPEDYLQTRDGPLDLLHCNSIFVMEDPELAQQGPLWALDNVLVSSRHQNLLFVVNLHSKELVWSWSDPGVHGQHEASVLPNGNFLFFDNGTEERGYSRIVELDPLKREIVWQYTAPNATDFFSRARGTAQELKDGVFLVGYSERGEAFQIDRDGRILWRYLSPFRNDDGERGVIRVQYYERELVRALIEGESH